MERGVGLLAWREREEGQRSPRWSSQLEFHELSTGKADCTALRCTTY